jgi:serine/threonine-protein kinase
VSVIPPVVQLPKQGDSLLGKYILEKPLGQGGMGIVYAAWHELLGQRVAVKFLLPEIASHGDSVARFLNEARAASRIESDHVARVLDVGLVDGALPYMVLEFLDGDDLAIVLGKRGPLPFAEVADFLLEAIDALAYAHSLGIVHRDLKPSNLFLVQRKDGSARVKVLDFGISKMMGAQALGGDLTKTKAMLGSPLYMSPEQLRDSKSVDHRCDIWALGVIAYELLTSHPPFMADNAVALFAAIQESEPMSLRARRPDGTIPPELERAVLRCLRRNPNERFPSVTELGAALAPFATGAGMRAFENAKRILPLRVAATMPMGSRPFAAPLPSPSTHTETAPGGAYASTANPWAKSHTAAAPWGRGRGRIVALGLAGVLGIAGALAGARFVMVHRQGGAQTAAAVASPASETRPPSASAATSLATSTVGAVSPLPSVATPSPPSAAPATPALGSRASPAPRPVGAATPPPPAAASASPSPSLAPARPSPGAPALNCEPPYAINKAGHHEIKPGCE